MGEPLGGRFRDARQTIRKVYTMDVTGSSTDRGALGADLPPQQSTFDMLSIARSYVAAGLSVIPIAPGTKHPYASRLPTVWDADNDKTKPTWRPYQERLPNLRELARWFDGTDAGIGIVGGKISGGLVVLDFETVESYDAWCRAVVGQIPGDLPEALPTVATASGRHVYFRMDSPDGNRKLARIGKTVIVETRGEGGYVLAPPSVHPSGHVYTLLHGDFAYIPLLADTYAYRMLEAARDLTPSSPHPANASGGNAATASVIDEYNKRHSIESQLEAHGYTPEGPGRYVRPGGTRSSVVITDGRSAHYNTADALHSEAPDGGVHSHSAFSAWCVLDHNGDMKAAVKAAAAELGMSNRPSDNELLTQAGRALGMSSDPSDTFPYFVREGGFWIERTERDGSPKLPQRMTNFTAAIIAEKTLHDGDAATELYCISATCGKRTRMVEMERSEFEGEGALGRIVAALGAKARVNPGTQSRYVLDAIKAFSATVEEHVMYTHTGWVEGRYLFGNGYIDVEGWHASSGESSSRAHLPDRLDRYQLQPAGTPDESLATFDHLLDLAAPAVMVPLIGGVLLAPLLHQLDAPAPMIHLYGPTGSHKTSISCAALALWGDFTPSRPTDTWTSTANSVQRLGWHLKDAPMLLDDYKAANVKSAHVTFLLQNYGDGMARGRLDSNSEARSAYPIRGVLISSGEDQPEGEASTLARILSVGLARGAVQRDKLTAVQQDARRLHQLTIAYLQWLTQRPLARDPQALHQEHRALILTALEETEHATNAGRIASNAAALYVAWTSFTHFLIETQRWPAARGATWLDLCRYELVALAKLQIELTTGERYSQLFLDAVRGLVASGRAVLLDLESENQEMTTSQVLIGGRDHQGLYLIADVAYDEVCKAAKQAGRTVAYTKRALGQLLGQDGALVSRQPPSLVMRKRLNRVYLWCWHLAPDTLNS